VVRTVSLYPLPLFCPCQTDQRKRETRSGDLELKALGLHQDPDVWFIQISILDFTNEYPVLGKEVGLAAFVEDHGVVRNLQQWDSLDVLLDLSGIGLVDLSLLNRVVNQTLDAAVLGRTDLVLLDFFGLLLDLSSVVASVTSELVL
jgi:hypothetical protein